MAKRICECRKPDCAWCSSMPTPKPRVGLLAIDPGTDQSGWVIYDGECILDSGICANHDIYPLMWRPEVTELAIEMIASYGMPVGKEVFETCLWIGRFDAKWPNLTPTHYIYRKDVKMELCGSPRAKDANIRQALIDRIGPQGTKKEPGPTFGVKSHAWAALGVAVTAYKRFA